MTSRRVSACSIRITLQYPRTKKWRVSFPFTSDSDPQEKREDVSLECLSVICHGTAILLGNINTNTILVVRAVGTATIVVGRLHPLCAAHAHSHKKTKHSSLKQRDTRFPHKPKSALARTHNAILGFAAMMNIMGSRYLHHVTASRKDHQYTYTINHLSGIGQARS